MSKGVFIAAFVLLLTLTPSGLHPSGDSVVYIDAANTLHAGMWFDGAPMTHFPPLFVVVIAGLGLDGLRLLHALIYAANVSLMAILLHDAGAPSLLARWVSVVIGLSSVMVFVHTRILTEPLFLLFLLLTILALGRGKFGAAVVFAALSSLQRYTGIVVIGVVCYVLLQESGGLHRLGAAAAVLMDGAKRTCSGQRRPNAGVASGDDRHADERGASAAYVANPAAAARRTRRASVVFIALYLAFLIVSISLFDATTPLDERILLPVLPLMWVCAAPYLAQLRWKYKTPSASRSNTMPTDSAMRTDA